MATISALPGQLNIHAKRGDELSQLVDFSIALTGYTFEAEIVSVLTGATLAGITVTAVNLATGQVNLSMTEAETEALPRGSYLWRLIWTAPGVSRRTALEGLFESL
jgi:hypothetical protein